MCTIDEVTDHGAYATLDEYGDKEGMIHIREIASGWIKNIRRHVKEGQKTVCKVLDIDKEKDHINLSMRRVKDSQRSWKSEQWKRDRKAENLLNQVANRVGEDLDAAYEEIGFPLSDEFDDIYTAFEETARAGREVLEEHLEADEDWIEALMDLIETSVEPPTVDVKGYVNLKSSEPEGVKVISSALQEAQKQISDSDSRVSIQYVGAPTYLIEVTAPAYKTAEKTLREAADKAISLVEEKDGSGEFYTERPE